MSESTRLTSVARPTRGSKNPHYGFRVLRERIGYYLSNSEKWLPPHAKEYPEEFREIPGAVRKVVHLTDKERQAIADELMSGRILVDDTTRWAG
jgi:hypothetical protein